MVTTLVPTPSVDRAPLRAGASLPAPIFEKVRRHMLLEGCKWDPQVQDVSTLSAFPLLLSGEQHRELSQLAAQLTDELLAAEQALLQRPALHRALGVPGRLRRLLRQASVVGATPAAARVMRFDFHWTRAGWRISEVNSDVPGGFTEASELPAQMAQHYGATQPAGHPGNAWARAIAGAIAPGQPVGLLAATGFLEDQQILAYLAKLLQQRGVASRWIAPRELCWRDGFAYCTHQNDDMPLAAIVRFFQAEWLHPRHCRELFVGGKTPVTNPGIAVLTESKRLPLVWDALPVAMPTWRRLLPQTADPRQVKWRGDDAWLVKSAYCNTGDTVYIRSLLSDRQWRSATRAIAMRPSNWIAQARFETLPIDSPVGMIYPCLGVYTIDGKPAGIYGRYSRRPLIDYAAVDVAVLTSGTELGETS